MFRLIFYAVLFYLMYRIIKIFSRIVSNPSSTGNRNVNHTEKQEVKNNNYNIQQKDIIEADFKEIKDDEEKKAGT
jgi:hypothetical protein